MRKNIRVLLLNKSTKFQTTSSNYNKMKLTKKSPQYAFLEFSNTKENNYNSRIKEIKTYNQQSLNLKQSYSRYKNFLQLSEIHTQFPPINNSKIININNYKIFNGFNDYFLSQKFQIKNNVKKNDKNSFNKNNKNLLLDSIEISKNDYPRYIFLSKIFKIKQSKSKKDFINIDFGKTSKDKLKNYKQRYSEDYKNYIIKKVKLNYNENFESSFVHKIKTDYMIEKVNKKYPIKSDENENDYSHRDKEFSEEKKDTVDENDLTNDKIFRKIKNVLFNQNKKYIIGNETKNYFKNKENKINFLYDINLIPHFKNNLMINNINSFQKRLEKENFIEYKTLRYLNKAKVIIQKMKDDSNYNECVLFEEDEEKNNIDNKIINDEENIKKFKDKYESFETEDYLSKKKVHQSFVRIIDQKTKKFFYGTFLKMHNKKK